MITRSLAGLALPSAAAVIAGVVWISASTRCARPGPPRLAVHPNTILADGYETAELTIDPPAEQTPQISIEGNAHGATLEGIGSRGAQIRAGVLPGKIVIRVGVPGRPAATAELTSRLDERDRFEDGTPDFLRLDDDHDRQAFRRWFTYLAEEQYFQGPAARPPEIKDCAALIRYAYREALHTHDDAWTEGARLRVVPPFDSPEKYQYPFTPLGAALFRVQPGPFRRADLAGGAFSQFADAQTLWRRNTHPVGRDVTRASPGDLLFFRQPRGREPFHSMIYLGESGIRPDGRRYILYHTGPDGANPGEMRRLTVEELARFPEPEWRPLDGNPGFLGVYRWNILRKDSENHALQN